MTELKPCPFCNGYAAIERFGTALTSTQYTCQHCGAFLETGEEFNHGNVWNTRPREAQLDAEIADLRAQITDPKTVTITRARYEEYQAAEERLTAYEGQLTADEMRDRCAYVADTCDSPYGCATQEQDYACSDMAYRIATAIRALSTKREEG